ncbi:unnamed protein product [Heligmosomoides polygyrus]|uniref:Endo/exonuclease/phosphatase domain-containing protein n=1 Tax=Heligmosomoides polygyrus TaxID=6339 RepID=A0A3P8BPI2_HELPZ|nr:unnamed protein product [Heligmosomoides polygyrus]
MRRCGSVPALTVFVAYAPTSDYDDEGVEAFYVKLKKFYREGHTFHKMIVGDLNAEIGPRRSTEELHIGTHEHQHQNIEEVKKTMNVRLRAHLFDSTVLPALTYAYETWAIRKQYERSGESRGHSEQGQA